MRNSYIVESPKQLRGIIAPGREDILDAIAAIGPSSITEIAEFLGRPRHSLYYHVRALRDCGLLVETQDTGRGTRTTARYDLPGRPIVVRFNLKDKRSRNIVVALGRARLRSATRGFARACHSDFVIPEGARRNLWVTRMQGWLSTEEVEDLNRHLRALIRIMYKNVGPPTANRKCHELTFALAPVVVRAPGAFTSGKRRRHMKGATGR